VIEEGSGRPVIVDFGLAGAETDPGARFIGGTPGYMAPEQAATAAGPTPVTHRADIFSFGCTAFTLLTGTPPFADCDLQSLLTGQWAEVPLPSSIDPELQPFDAPIARMLEVLPENRFDTIRAAFDALVRAAGPLHVPRPTTMSPPSRASHDDAPAAPLSPGAKLEILVVDDDESFRAFSTAAAEIALCKQAVHVTVAANGREAVELAAALAPQIVILDYDMPELDGLRALAELRDLGPAGRARVLVCSARVGTQERWRFSVLGVRDFVQKPVDLLGLVTAIEEMGRSAGWVV
jgi:eukaryotic-like serine/threonine-protein kinase